MEGALLLNVVIRKSAAVLQLLAGEHQALLVWGDTLLVLNLRLHVVNGVRRLHLQLDHLSGQRLDKDLHAATGTKDQVQGALLLDVVIRKGASVFELLAGKDEALLIWGNALLVLDLRLHVVDGVGRLHLQRNGLAGQRLDENLHATTQTEH